MATRTTGSLALPERRGRSGRRFGGSRSGRRFGGLRRLGRRGRSGLGRLHRLGGRGGRRFGGLRRLGRRGRGWRRGLRLLHEGRRRPIDDRQDDHGDDDVDDGAAAAATTTAVHIVSVCHLRPPMVGLLDVSRAGTVILRSDIICHVRNHTSCPNARPLHDDPSGFRVKQSRPPGACAVLPTQCGLVWSFLRSAAQGCRQNCHYHATEPSPVVVECGPVRSSYRPIPSENPRISDGSSQETGSPGWTRTSDHSTDSRISRPTQPDKSSPPAL